MKRSKRGLINERRQQAGVLPNVEEFASAIANTCADSSLISGVTVFVGNTEW